MSLLLRREEEEEEREEEGDDDDRLAACAEQHCVACDEALYYTDEVFKLTIEHVMHNGCEAVLLDFLHNDGERAGDFFYEPLFFDFSCWEDAAEALRAMVEDSPPVRHHEELLACRFCESSICEWEIFATLRAGELHVSPRMPRGEGTGTFICFSKPYPICLGCLLLLHTHELALWDEPVSQLGECQECTHIRCWRYGKSCPCPCHTEENQ